LEYRFSKTPLWGELDKLSEPVGLVKVDETKWESFWDRLVREHHYLGYVSVIGCRVKYLVTLGARVVGAISFCSAAYKLGPRDAFIGWDEATRLAMLPRLVSNNRFLLLPWIRVRNLASHVLSLSLRRMSADWESQYGVRPCMAETFVDGERFAGTCHAAANWIRLGTTKGYGRQGNGFVYHGHPRVIYVKVMDRDFASAFHPNVARLDGEREELLAMLNDIPVFFPSILARTGIDKVNPELVKEMIADFLKPFTGFLARRERREHFLTLFHGYLSDLERKSMEPISLEYAKKGETRNVQNFMTRSTWDNEGMLDKLQAMTMSMYSDEYGMLTGDGCDFPKKGTESAGVHRQCRGPLGKVDSRQASVMLGMAGENGYGLLDYQLYMPKAWFEPPRRAKWEKCCVPEDLEFKTKNEILLEMINRAVESGRFKGRYVGVDCSFGKDSKFLDGLPPRLVYFADVPSDQQVFLSRPEVAVPEYGGRGGKPAKPAVSFPPVSVSRIADDDRLPWRQAVIGNGAKGPILASDKCVRVIESRGGLPGKEVWLHVRKLEDNSVKFSLCNEAADADLEAIRRPAAMRWSIGQCFKECKDCLGMDHYELRTWHGWRRHILIVLMAHLFLNMVKNRYRISVDTPGPTPFVKGPVPHEAYAEDFVRFQNDEEPRHPNLSRCPDRPVCPLTIGMVRTLISENVHKVGKWVNTLWTWMKGRFDSYECYSIQRTLVFATPPTDKATPKKRERTL
jgi:SRSO17 transposase